MTMPALTSISAILAEATSPAAGSGGFLGNPLVMMGFMAVMMYFIAIRPQQQKAKELAARIAALKVGDEVVTNAGMHGVVASIKDHTVMIKVADNVKIEFDKGAVAAVATKAA
jgi:preprotein translocase subunit YajC